MKWEVITAGRNSRFPERNNARYFVVNGKPSKGVGEKFILGDYEIEVVYLGKLPNTGIPSKTAKNFFKQNYIPISKLPVDNVAI